MDLKQLRAEIRNLNFMLDDALTEAKAFKQAGDYLQVEECAIRITDISKQIQLREKHLADRINFSRIIHDLNSRGILCEAVKRYAHQS